jgi:HK97 family phage major capsid protein
MSTEIEIKQELSKISDQVKEHAEKAIAEAKKGIAMAEGQKERVDELLVKQGELNAQVQELLQKAARRGGEPVDQGPRTAGYSFIESEAYKSFTTAGDRLKQGQQIRVDVKAITSLNNSAGTLVAPDRRDGIIAIPQRPLSIRDLLAPGRTNSTLIQYFRETLFANNAAPVAEGTLKPESNITFEQRDAKVIKLAHWIKATTEILDDAPALQSVIDQRLRYGLQFVEDLQLLMGSGAANNLSGIYTNATAYAAPFAVAGETRIDRLRLAFLQGELALLPADAAIMHPSDWAQIELLKDTQGRYLIGNPQGTLAPTLWGRRIVTTLAMPANSFLAGNFRDSAQIFDREDANVVVSTENQDDFIYNRVTIMAEERLALADYRPEARVKGTFTPAA